MSTSEESSHRINHNSDSLLLRLDDSGVATSADLPSGLEEEDIEFDPRPVSSSSSLEYNQRYSANTEPPGEFEDEDEEDVDGLHQHVSQNGLNYHDSNDNEEQYHRHRRHHRHRSHGSNTTVGSNLTFKHAAHCTANTIRQHYYPEGGWGWIIVFVAMIVQILTHGLHLAWGVLLIETLKKFPKASYVDTGWLGALSTGVALLVSPVTIAFCRRKSTRLTAVMGGLVTALGCLFTSFASQFHQLFFSYGTVVGVGVGMTRDCSTLMVAQYFKRRREFVEIFIVSGSGLGIAIMSAFIKGAISAIGWRFGLQVITVAVFFTFFLGTFYRSASLYHPQRRAILHLKNQKRKIKDKNKVDDRPPFFDFSTLRSKTVRILLMSTGISAFGINTPIFYLAHQAEEEGLGDTAVLLQTYLGLAWTLGCAAFGILVVHNNVECRIARQYLCQAAVFMCGLSILALTAVKGNYHGYVMFAWIYGIFCGGYHYSLKMYTYERVRARNFARTWGFVQCSQAIPIAIGVPISGYINVGCGGKAGYYFSSTCVLVGSLALFLIDLHRRNLSRHKHTRANGTKHLCVSDNCPQRRRLSFTQEPDNDGLAGAPGATAAAALIVGNDLDGHHHPADGYIDTIAITDKPELTCISEEGIADMDLPDNILDDLDYIGDCITSCNKVENYLMLSEFENNLIAEMPVILDRKGRRWSIAKSRQNTQIGNAPGIPEEVEVEDPNETSVTMHQQHQSAPLNSGRPTSGNNKWTNKPSNNATEKSNFIQQRTITVIDEASV
ncbi:monocarboxylate transporter 10-like [Chrysoperla carnea]|uniref:monocarboxylate transporter 10-like n=1 Tax=Chrysoperla carnea TaxID=189513 RepID=UPI001D0939AC|nr:monocarboxylate transporter 10-like [Chrysoperla carnea]